MIQRRRLRSDDMEMFRKSLRRLSAEYGLDDVKRAASMCNGRPVYAYFDENDMMVGFEAIDKATGQVTASCGECYEEAPVPIEPVVEIVQESPTVDYQQMNDIYEEDAQQSDSEWVPVVRPVSVGNGQSANGYSTVKPVTKETNKDSHIGVKIAVGIVIAVVVAIAGYFVWGAVSSMISEGVHSEPVIDEADPDYDSYQQAPADAVVHVVVENGDNIIAVREKMLDVGLVSAAREFAPEMRSLGGTESLKTADYVIPASETAGSIAQRMASGIRVPEGVIGINAGDDIRDIAVAIDNAHLGFTGVDFIAEAGKVQIYKQTYSMMSMVPDDVPSMEGLFPEGEYNLALTPNVAEATHVMLRRAQSEFEASGLDSKTFYDTLIKASLIEKEALFDEDRPLIASVIENRLREGMQLQIDASIKYATGSDETRVLYSDLEVDSPYNTYIHHGLPVTPICSGISPKSYEAALHPATTNYLYYVLKDLEGHHVFSETTEQFEIDRNHYLELFGYDD